MSAPATQVLDEREAAQYRNEFPIFENTVYLNSCSLGPPSRRVFAALQEYQDDWSRYGAPAWWKLWLPRLDAAKQRFARLIGAAEHEVTISHSISSALSSVASTVDYGKRSAVVCANLDFPTIPYQWLARKHQGVDVRYARSTNRIDVPLEIYDSLVDSDVSLIATSHVFYASGAIQPVRELADLAHSRGSKILVDGYHAVGVLPVDVKAMDVDFYLGGTLKWLLGGPGLTFIYVREDLIANLEPTVTGWFSSADQFAFDSERLSWPATADRLELGTPSVPTAYAGVAGMDMVMEADPARIFHRIQRLTQRIVDKARAAGHEIVSPAESTQRAGIVMLRVERPQETVAALSDLGYTVDYRPGLIRVSPHFYNTEADVDGFMNALAHAQAGSR
ncbi:MAG TPA: aminotransferase class V-fold PLP-dependent enzyme [Chloroflexota bacterium]